MQQDMKCDVTCCTVTSASHLGILCLASGRSEDTRFTDKSLEQHQLLIQRSEDRFTPKNAALLIIDYQPLQVSSIVSMDHRTLVAIIVAVARLGKLYALPIVLSTSRNR
jgi:hypothetical protein